MQVDFSQPILNLDGTVLIMEGTPTENMSLGKVCQQALLAPLPNEGMKEKRLFLALAILGAKEPLELKSEDIALIKRFVEAAVPFPLLAAQALALLEGLANPVKAAKGKK